MKIPYGTVCPSMHRLHEFWLHVLINIRIVVILLTFKFWNYIENPFKKILDRLLLIILSLKNIMLPTPLLVITFWNKAKERWRTHQLGRDGLGRGREGADFKMGEEVGYRDPRQVECYITDLIYFSKGPIKTSSPRSYGCSTCLLSYRTDGQCL